MILAAFLLYKMHYKDNSNRATANINSTISQPVVSQTAEFYKIFLSNLNGRNIRLATYKFEIDPLLFSNVILGILLVAASLYYSGISTSSDMNHTSEIFLSG